MQTRSATQGKPLKKPGAYNTDLYYQEKDQGYGDVGVDQERDAGAVDNPEDPEFTMTKDEEQRATERGNMELSGEDVDLGTAKEEVEELKRPAEAGEAAVDERGEPVPIVEGDLEEQEVPENTYVTQ